MQSNQTKNNQYLLKKWIPAILSVIAVIAILILLIVVKSDFLYFFIAIIAITTGYAVIMNKYQYRKYKEAWLKPTATEAANAMNRRLVGLRDKKLKDVIMAANTGIVCLVYGERDKALTIIDNFNWGATTPYQHSFKYTMIALDNYLYADNHHNGLFAANKAKELATISTKFPGSKETIAMYNLYVVIGKILTEGTANESLAELEELYHDSKPNKKPNMIAEWALANAYYELGDHAKSAEMLERCKKTAPFGVMLHKIKA
ncbi:hypothetical protein [Listeria grandensis]|uniref:hypothetical protein n=1 Tax=Listeria grandensis TaxID=1494963 RepID=UPI00164D3190|nr:hypothetical protein [Listeria grandensis]MBC6316520.1 hypothetical protein [Listeria grandensis]